LHWRPVFWSRFGQRVFLSSIIAPSLRPERPLPAALASSRPSASRASSRTSARPRHLCRSTQALHCTPGTGGRSEGLSRS
jgi:hypothetical protein